MPKRKKSLLKHDTQSQSEISAHAANGARILAGIAIIILAASTAYWHSISGTFIVDDDWLLTNNLIIKDPGGLYQFWCTADSPDYWPVTNSTFWLEWRLWGMNPTGYRATNMILHVLESLLIWLILRQLSIPGAFFAAVIFAVHPVNVESVAWIAQRKNLMAMLFFLLSILWYLKAIMPMTSVGMALARSHGGPWERGIPSTAHCPPPTSSFILHPSSWYWLSLAAFVSAMLGKGSAAVLPALLLGIIWWLRPLRKWDLLLTAPFFIIAVTLAAVNVWFQTHGNYATIRDVGFVERLLGAGGLIWFYLYKAILPINLVFFYPQWNVEAGNPLWWIPLIAAVIVTVILWLYRKTWSRAFLFAWGFFCVSLVPVMGFTDVGAMKHALAADRYQHIAIIGLIALAASGWDAWRRRANPTARRLATAVAVAAAAILTFLTWQQTDLYRDPVKLYENTLKNNPGCWLIHNEIGLLISGRNQLSKEIEHYKKTIELNPDFPDAHNNLGVTLVQTGRLPEAIEQFEKALAIRPKYPEAQNNLGKALFISGRLQEAIDHYRTATQLNPKYVTAYFNLALAYSAAGRTSDAVAAAQRALELAQSQGDVAQANQIQSWLNSRSAGD